MAIICIASFPKRSANLCLLRLIKHTYCEHKLVHSSPKFHVNHEDAPVKYTTNKASKITIAETIGLSTETKGNKFTPHIILGTLACFLIYFCILREENDLDEVLKGNAEETDQIKLLKLKMQLSYCVQNKLPTELLETKIKELENKISLSLEEMK